MTRSAVQSCSTAPSEARENVSAKLLLRVAGLKRFFLIFKDGLSESEGVGVAEFYSRKISVTSCKNMENLY